MQIERNGNWFSRSLCCLICGCEETDVCKAVTIDVWCVVKVQEVHR